MELLEYNSEIFPLKEYRGDNIYAREVKYPAGCLLIGKEHKTNHLFLLVQGKVTIWTIEGKVTIKAPAILESKKGVQRIGYFHENSTCMNFHGCPNEVENPEDYLTIIDQEKVRKLLKKLIKIERLVAPLEEWPSLQLEGTQSGS